MMKHLRYLKYVLKHKWYVLLQCWAYGLFWRGITHDLSKFYPSEWFAYADYFYGKKPPYQTDEIKQAFQKAWLHHQNRNRHHWQYWIEHKSDGMMLTFKMPDADVLEMVADWVGAGHAITGKVDVWGWYKKNMDDMYLHTETRARVETLLYELGQKHGVEFKGAKWVMENRES